MAPAKGEEEGDDDDEDEDEDEDGDEEEEDSKLVAVVEPADGLGAEAIIGGLNAPRSSRSRRPAAAGGGAAAASKPPARADGEEAELSDF